MAGKIQNSIELPEAGVYGFSIDSITTNHLKSAYLFIECVWTMQFNPESELFTGDTFKDNHSPGPVPSPYKTSKLSN